ncbi:phenylacetate-CoA oxygenase/reductase subunit PaaK [Verrucosispora sp. WMMA2044]|uniref:Phenylacetate-CoA oxygenase/reductase subunit PaaK n=1 Tax=Verrucosispora sioxanthis TaxID=2499994 RepID=A0A6M1KRR1_9ACTN|nr:MULTISPECIES: 1,2-phenylacetyl-CoA epoxidase subunit PaaE [Micromonospora]NEE63528.1 phenylacetate-CoA oxygenase/reductase subunit PaaK [Verrucosispora sioxanthis]NGM12638.1 phenylacetate-CoA oxygenase/reductase subunit PaaK [Verrucosispora sioxanthis]WBB48013.1 phenylacetate-CoA oxygenase/reductase subunit PaaK [Verrucosispora sp. WMMA2044]
MTVTITRPVRRRPVFHPLPVVAVDRLTADAVAITFAVPEELRETFAFRAGQHLTVRLPAAAVAPDGDGGGDVRRSYSICSTPAELARHGRLRIGVREIPGGAFSGYACGALRHGDTIEVLPPLGHFTTAFAPDRARRYGAVVAGSGITPVLSLVATALAVEPASTFTLVYGNRTAGSVMFAEELADLKDRYPTRLHLVHVLSREQGDSPLLSGRIDAERLGRLLETIVPGEAIEEWFLCGPYGLVVDARAVLTERGVAESAVHTELFHVDAPPEPVRRSDDASGGTDVTITLDGRSSSFTMRRDERVLDAALKVRGELPYACKGGVCSTCRAKVVSGEVEMACNYALEPDEVAAGYVLTCQSSPLTDTLTIDYDA